MAATTSIWEWDSTLVKTIFYLLWRKKTSVWCCLFTHTMTMHFYLWRLQLVEHGFHDLHMRMRLNRSQDDILFALKEKTSVWRLCVHIYIYIHITMTKHFYLWNWLLSKEIFNFINGENTKFLTRFLISERNLKKYICTCNMIFYLSTTCDFCAILSDYIYHLRSYKYLE